MKRIAFVLTLLALAGCSTPDEEIRANIAGKAQDDLNFAGLTYTVHNGSVDFTGSCPSKKAFAKVQQSIKNIHVIKSVNYHVNIAPVQLNTLTPVKLLTDSIISKYPQVTASISETGITLKGPIAAAKRSTIITDLQSKQPLAVRDSMQVY